MEILTTGSTGFLGTAIISALEKNNILHNIGRSKPECDIVANLVKDVPEIPNKINAVVHIAGLAHLVPRSKEEQLRFFNDNVSITQNLLKALDLQESKPRYFLFISSVSVYGLESGEDINETYPLNAKDPYGLSKIKSEQLILEWCNRNDVLCTVFRLPLVAGIAPPGNLGSMISAIKNGYYVRIMGKSPKRSVVLANDVANIVEGAIKIGGVFNLTDGRNITYKELEMAIKCGYGFKRPTILLPLMAVVIMAKVGDFIERFIRISLPINSNKLNKLTSDLTFQSVRSRHEINWQPKSVLEFYYNLNQ